MLGDVLTVRPEGDEMRLAYTVWGRDTTGHGADVGRTVLGPRSSGFPSRRHCAGRSMSPEDGRTDPPAHPCPGSSNPGARGGSSP